MKFTYTTNARPVDGYTIRRGLHRGGFGEVYYAVSDAGKEVALKLLTHDLDTELRGIRQCLNLKHPNLVTLFDVKTDAEGDSWVVMEYVSGASLEDVLAAFPNGLPRDEVRDWMTGILAGVDYLHGRGIVHRDLKPANIYRENGVVKIGDVGLSKQMGGTRRQHTEAVGTVYYMAPEVAKGQYGPEVDVYSLGVMLFELLTGDLPFDGETTAEILMKHLANQPDLSAIPASLRPVVAKALEKDPANRIRSARQFHELLSKVWTVAPLPDSAFEPVGTGTASASQAATLHTSYSHTSDTGSGVQSAPKPEDAQSARNGCDPFAQHRQASFTGSTAGSAAGSSKGEVRQLLDDVVGRVKTRVRETVDDALQKEWMFHEKRKDERRRREEKLLRKEQESAAKAARKSAERAAKAARRDNPEQQTQWWIGLALLAVIFVPWQRMSWGESLAVAGCCTLAAYWAYSLSRPWQASPERSWSLLPSVGAASRPEMLAWSTLVAAVAAVLVTLAGVSVWSILGSQTNRYAPGIMLPLEMHVWMTLIVWLVATAVLLTYHLLRPAGASTESDVSLGWLSILLGIAAGAAVFQLSEFLEVRDIPVRNGRPMFRQLGSHAMADSQGPTMVAYMVCFSLMLWLQNWNWCLKPSRKRRMKLKPVFWAALAGFFAALVSGLPWVYVMLWSTAITTTAQIAAPWQPAGERRVPLTTAA